MQNTTSHTKFGNGKVLILDDDPDMLGLLRHLFEEQGLRATGILEARQLIPLIKQQTWDLIVMDLYIGDATALELMPEVAREAPFSKIAVISAFGSIDTAVFAMELGAATFLQKSGDARDLVSRLIEILQQAAPAHANDLVRLGASAYTGSSKLEKPEGVLIAREGSAGQSRAEGLSRPLIGSGPAMMALKSKLPVVAEVDATVLVTGEAGTGKELVARAIHELSPRSRNRFEAINCSAIPEAMLESELFGHRRGAFAEATRDHNGVFAECLGGTVFLDEISALPPLLQVKLLHVLQEKEVKPLGATTSLPVDVRVIVSSHKNLLTEVAEGRFREDLYYRLSVLPLCVPPLRERKEDLPELAWHFAKMFAERYGKLLKGIPSELIDKVTEYHWPGNVRELQNAIERAVVLSSQGNLSAEHLFWSVQSELAQKVVESGDQNPELSDGQSEEPEATELRRKLNIESLVYSEAKESFERNFLAKLLEHTQGNVSEAARVSGRFRSDLYRLMSKYNLNSEPFRKDSQSSQSAGQPSDPSAPP